MISPVEKKDFYVEKIIKENRFQNHYFFIDYETVFENSNQVSVWKIIESKLIVGLILKYYNSLQIICVSSINIEELKCFIKNGNYSMISGPKDILSKITLDNYKLTNGNIMKYTGIGSHDSSFFYANPSDCLGIAKLICSDNGIGGHYSIDELTLQLKNRLLYENCRNLIYVNNGDIVCHCGTYAEFLDIAVIGGVITKNEFRGKGLGKKIVLKIVDDLVKENKIPLLYVFNDKSKDWYESMGFVSISECSKLERIN